MLWLKKNSYKEFDNEKKFLRLENSPPPPHNFSNGPSQSPREPDNSGETPAGVHDLCKSLEGWFEW